jgi:quercetin dioxygenase-like cupin family protein
LHRCNVHGKLSGMEFLGASARILADADEGAPLGVVEMRDVPAGQMPPLHVHRAQDEAFYVLEGKVTLFMPGREVSLGPGDYALGPRDVPHTYRVGDDLAAWLVISNPAGFERFVAEVSAAGSDPARLDAIAARHEIEILGPPGTLP